MVHVTGGLKVCRDFDEASLVQHPGLSERTEVRGPMGQRHEASSPKGSWTNGTTGLSVHLLINLPLYLATKTQAHQKT